MTDADFHLPDTQPGGMHVDGQSCIGHAADRAKEYAATIHFIGLLACLTGTPEEQEEARALVRQAIEEFGLPTNLSSARDAEVDTRRAYERARAEHGLATALGDTARARAAKLAEEKAYATYRQAYDHRTAVMHGSFNAFFENLWTSFKTIYQDAITAIDNGTWKVALCKAAVDAGYAVTEEGIALALVGLGLGVAALTLKFVGRVAKPGSNLVKVFVRSERNFLKQDSFDPSKPAVVEKSVGDIDTSTDLSDAEKKLLGSDNQGTTAPDRDKGAAEAKGGGEQQSNDNDAEDKKNKKSRSIEELLPDGKVPTLTKGFEKWFDELSPDELDKLWAIPKHHRAIKRQMLNGGEKHEWLKRSQLPKLKRLGFSAAEVMDWTSPTKLTEGPDPTRQPGERWRHSKEGGGRGSGVGSKKMHESLDEIIETAESRQELLRRLGYWANSWLDNGVDSFPDKLKEAITTAGGG
ncbi:hypothetical protein [Pseudovibrio sp. Ad37]|uniref:hypothetical protein n=1 Tax=Pseudovibrio sp. Ad37 TaxID=989422 RepID=UPI0007AEE168|nr:hypothetical protein [Pseudovibrio sp. Ad37]KZL13051.1 hypothetical protein PsAD37_05547 [Pseudovibrio sp. Ad37]